MDPRSRRVREEIGEAAVRLLISSGMPALTVSGICRESGVSRSAFYGHFQSPEEAVLQPLLASFANLKTRLAGKRLSADTLLLDGKPLSFYFFEHVEKHQDFYRRVFGVMEAAQIIERIRVVVAEFSFEQHQPLRARSTSWGEEQARLVAEYLSGALVATTGGWVRQQCQPDARVMAYWFSSLAAPGVLEVMQLPKEDDA